MFFPLSHQLLFSVKGPWCSLWCGQIVTPVEIPDGCYKAGLDLTGVGNRSQDISGIPDTSWPRDSTYGREADSHSSMDKNWGSKETYIHLPVV